MPSCLLIMCTLMLRGPGSSVGIATDYGLDGPPTESRWGRDFPPIQTGPGAHPPSCTMGTASFPGVDCGRGVLLTTHPLLALRSWKSRAIPLPPLGLNRACNGVTLPYFNATVICIRSVDSSVSIVTKQWAVQLRCCGLIPSRCKKHFCS
jgi:hypothetical protein